MLIRRSWQAVGTVATGWVAGVGSGLVLYLASIGIFTVIST